MLVFVTTLRHPHNSTQYERVETLLEASLRSLCAQDDPRFQIVVVANRRPAFTFGDPRLHYHIVDYPPPTEKRASATGMDVVMRDKGTKLLSGVLYSKPFGPTYFAFLDADDFVSRRLSGFVNARPGRPGWYVDDGYVLTYRTRRMQRKSGLVRYCGTTVIVNATDLRTIIGDHLTPASTQEEMRASLPRQFLHFAMGDPSPYMVRFMADRGRRLKPLPFRSVVWLQGTGENHTAIRGLRSGIPLTEWHCREFGITAPAPSTDNASMAERASELALSIQSKIGTFRDRLLGFPPVPV